MIQWCFEVRGVWAGLVWWDVPLVVVCEILLIFDGAYPRSFELLIDLVDDWKVLRIWSNIKSSWKWFSKCSKLKWSKFCLCSWNGTDSLKLWLYLIIITHMLEVVILLVISVSTSDLLIILEWNTLIHLKVTCLGRLLILLLTGRSSIITRQEFVISWLLGIKCWSRELCEILLLLDRFNAMKFELLLFLIALLIWILLLLNRKFRTT